MKRALLSAAIVTLLSPLHSYAHTVNYELAAMPQTDVAWRYLELGFTHILPLGLDHILFVLSIFFLSNRLKTVIWQATAFTIAHSITLGLAMYGYLKPLSAVVEPIIALSIFFVAVENLLARELKPGRLALVFAFGLVHGMGFAGVLTELGLPGNKFALALLSFNAGVELGQIAVILAAYGLVGRWWSDRSWYRARIVHPVSLGIALIALYWTLERSFS